MEKRKHITALGLNPAWQKTLFFSQLDKGEVNRAEKVSYLAAGKGVNFCRAARLWGQPTMLLQFAGGWTGENIESALRQELLPYKTVKVSTDTRVCTTCLCKDSGKMTELIEPSGHVTDTEITELLDLLDSELNESTGLALCGTVPPGVNSTIYSAAVKEAAAHNIPVLLDAYKDVDEVLEQGVTILKINYDEILKLTGEPDLNNALKFCFKNYPGKIIAITAGASTAYLAADGNNWKFALPAIDDVINPLGAGDTVSAVFFSEFLKGTPLPDAFATGLAAASASCLSEKCAVYNKEIAMKLKRQIKITSC